MKQGMLQPNEAGASPSTYEILIVLVQKGRIRGNIGELLFEKTELI